MQDIFTQTVERCCYRSTKQFITKASPNPNKRCFLLLALLREVDSALLLSLANYCLKVKNL
jgi:hypothetical protein